MAKAAKPNFQHTSPAVQVGPRNNRTDQKSGKRKRISQTIRTDQAMTDIRWKKVISAVANGHLRKEAAAIAGITVQSIDAYLISNVSAYKQLRDAKLAWNRRGWDSDLIDDVLNDMACGLSLKRSCLKHGISDRYDNLMRLIHGDNQIREAYDNARELWAESFLDDTIDIADDSSEDRLDNGKVNHEVVNRSKLRIDARWRAMGAMVKKRFGDSKHIEIEGDVTFSHIAMLTGARKRLEKIRPGTVENKVPVTIENETGEVQQEN